MPTKKQQSSLAKLEGTTSPAMHPARTHTQKPLQHPAQSRGITAEGLIHSEQDSAARAMLPYKDHFEDHIEGKQGESRWAKVQLPNCCQQERDKEDWEPQELLG